MWVMVSIALRPDRVDPSCKCLRVLLLTSAVGIIAMTDVNGLMGVCSVYSGADEQASNDFKVNRNKIHDKRVSAGTDCTVRSSEFAWNK